jgi:tricarballylate dehydrogenase
MQPLVAHPAQRVRIINVEVNAVNADTPYDFLAVGCGAAGLSAALTFALTARAAKRTVRVAVLESSPIEERGGATRWTTAGLRGTKTEGLDPMWVGLVAETSKGLADLEYCRTLERETRATFAFLEQHGIQLLEHRLPLANTMSIGTSMPNGGGHAIVNALAKAFEALPGTEILYRTEAVNLSLSANGAVNGVVVRGADGLLKTLRAAVVVLACGGFEGNKEMMTRYLGTNACDLKLIAPGIAYNRGAGINMAMAIGADTAGQFDMIHAELVDARTDRADAVIYPHPYGIVVNGEGRRFYDEGQNSFDATFELIAYEVWRNQKQTAFFIGDGHIRGNQAIERMFDTDQPPIEAQTPEDLAAQLGLEPEALEATIAEYNAATRPGPFDPTRLDGKATTGLTPPKSNWAYPLDSPPFFAYPVTAAVTFTYGGLRTDTVGRVLSGNGVAIPGLYAAGEIVGLFYHEYPSATSVLKALTFGRLAGRHAAEAAQTGSAQGVSR